MPLIVEAILFSVCIVGLFVGLPLWYFWRVWIPFTADIIERACHGEWNFDEEREDGE